MHPQDTIVAAATPPGRGGIGVIRFSGPAVGPIEAALCGRALSPRRAELVPFLDGRGQAMDRGIAIRYQAPASFTGEDVLELQGHGGPVVMDMVLERALELGARLAAPGEFSQRAFLNGKLDLAQAEAVADLIDAGSRQAARAARRSLDGGFSRRVHELVEQLIELRVYIEAALDFPEEEIDFLADGAIRGAVERLARTIQATIGAARQGRLLRDGITVVIAGPPNVGKSSLLNRLAERESAIVTDIAGTTRDVLRELIQIDGLPLHLIDTAGLRDSDDPVEREGVRRARQQLAAADRVLLMRAPGVDPLPLDALPDLPAEVGIDEIHNKIDLEGTGASIAPTARGQRIRLSVRSGEGMDLLRRHLKSCMAYEGGDEALFIARRRHLQALRRAAGAIDAAAARLAESAGELAAEELRQAQQFLGEITGEFSSDDLLGRIFSSFCIGK